MKKMLTLFLILGLCLLLTGCKNQQVRDMEAQIAAIGEVTLENVDAVEDAVTAFKRLSAEDQAKVENAWVLTDGEKAVKFIVSKAAYDKITEAYQITEDFGLDLYGAWNLLADATFKEFINGGIPYLMRHVSPRLTEDEIRTGLTRWRVGDGYGEDADKRWNALSSEEKQDKISSMNTDETWNELKNYTTKTKVNATVGTIICAYKECGKVQEAQQAYDEAKDLMKQLSDRYSDYEHYPNLKAYYTASRAYFELCCEPKCSFNQFKDSEREYQESIRKYIADLEYIFAD